MTSVAKLLVCIKKVTMNCNINSNNSHR
uniref:Uncharacterized protein n=1 Tax=Heterorhabditis bacteriophora TaxID=37862 RepID=A0A1I7WS94_HETBA